MALNLEEYRQASYDIWEAMASGWHRERDFIWEVSRAVGERMVQRLAPQPGQTILELAAGVGDTGFAASKALGDHGKLISTDFSPAMVERARAHGEELGLGNVEHRIMDAERMDLEDDSVDGVLCRWGYMLMADPAAALSETRRVLREGGRLCFSVWGAPERNEWAAIPGKIMVEQGHLPAPEPGGPGILGMADPERIRTLVTGARFSEPEIEEVPLEWAFPDFDAFWAFTNQIAGGLALTLAKLSEQEGDGVRTEVERHLHGVEGADGYRLPALCLNVVAS